MVVTKKRDGRHAPCIAFSEVLPNKTRRTTPKRHDYPNNLLKLVPTVGIIKLFPYFCMRKHENMQMSKLIINSYEEFATHLGQKLGETKKESPYKSTIAHGYLTLSLLPYLWEQIIEVHNLKMMVNYGMDQMRFGVPVITGSRVRLTATLHNIENLRGICKVQIKFAIEIEGQRKPALQGIATFLYYFN